jgi:hypothetical protein
LRKIGGGRGEEEKTNEKDNTYIHMYTIFEQEKMARSWKKSQLEMGTWRKM